MFVFQFYFKKSTKMSPERKILLAKYFLINYFRNKTKKPQQPYIATFFFKYS